MKYMLRAVLAALGLYLGCSKESPTVLSPAEFTEEYAQALRKLSPGLKVEIVDDRQLKVTSADGRETNPFLHNAYDAYRQDPSTKNTVIQQYATGNIEFVTAERGSVDPHRIVPVIKDREWLDETRLQFAERHNKAVENIYEDFAPGLVIVYVEDSPKHVRYLSPGSLKEAKIDREGLRSLACSNLKRLLPDVEMRGENGLYMLTVGGNYEASLLVFDSLWDGSEMKVRGDIVVAIPTRDVLLVTGIADRDNLARIKQIAAKAYAEGNYRLTPKLFVRRNGKFEQLSDDEAITR